MFIFLMVVQGLIALALIGVIMLQKNDGSGLSGLGGAGSPASFLSARGAADLLTRTTGILAALFMGMCIILAIVVNRDVERASITKDIPLAAGKLGAAGTVNSPPSPAATPMPANPTPPSA